MNSRHVLYLCLLALCLIYPSLLLTRTNTLAKSSVPLDFIDLTAGGLNPTVATVSLGTNVTWRNRTEEPYVLQSGYPYTKYLPMINQGGSTRRSQGENRVRVRKTIATSFGGEIAANGSLNNKFEVAGRFPYYVTDTRGNIITGMVIVNAPATPTATSNPTNTPMPTATSTTEPTAEPTTEPPVAFTLSSSAFGEGEVIPTQYTFNAPPQCSGDNLSVPLTWEGAPTATASFALIMDDPDAGSFVHWVQFNIPSEQSSLPSATGGPDIGLQGRNDFGQNGYGGPCPPSGTHRYVFTLYVLDSMLSLTEGATKAQLLAAMDNHILQQTQLTGVRSR